MTKTVSLQVLGQLENEKNTYNGVRLNLTVKELYADELSAPVDRAIARTELSHMSGMVIEDGKYKLRFSFNGAVQQHSVRVADGTLLAG